MKKLTLTLLLSTLVSCASTYNEKVVKRMDNLDDKPAWATLSNVMYEQDGTVYIIGYSTGSEDARIPALSRIADNNARFEISRYIKNEMGFFFQNVEEGTQGAELSTFMGRSFQSRSVITLRQPSATTKKYW